MKCGLMSMLLVCNCLLFASDFSLYDEHEYINIITQLLQSVWPDKKPNVLPYEHTWFSRKKIAEFNRLFSRKKFKLIVELGSWLGGSAKFFLNKMPEAHVIAIDHWKGSIEHQNIYSNLLPTLYETFLVNCWKHKDRLIPLRATTLKGMEYIYSLGLQPDLFYVDASHDYDSVMADLEFIYKYFPNTTITGDDWSWSKPHLGLHFPVRKAVQDFAKKYGFKIYARDQFWRLYF